MKWLKLHAWKVGDRGFVPRSGIPASKKQTNSSPLARKKSMSWGTFVTKRCSALNYQRSNFESCVWTAMSYLSYHHPQEVPMAQFSLYVHNGGLKLHSFHLYILNVFVVLYSHWELFISIWDLFGFPVLTICIQNMLAGWWLNMNPLLT